MTTPMWTVSRQLIIDTLKHPMMIVGLVLLLVPIAISVGFGGPARVFMGFAFLPLMMAGPGLAYAHRAETWVSTGIPRRTLLASGATIAAAYSLFTTLLMAAFGQHQATTLGAALSVVVSQDVENVVTSGPSPEWAGIVAAYGLLTLTFQVFVSQAISGPNEGNSKNQFVAVAVILGSYGMFYLISKTVGEFPAAIAVAALCCGFSWLLRRSSNGQPRASTGPSSSRSSISNIRSQQATGEHIPWYNTTNWFTGTTKVVIISVALYAALTPLALVTTTRGHEAGAGALESDMLQRYGLVPLLVAFALVVGTLLSTSEIGYARTVSVAAGRTKQYVAIRLFLALGIMALAVGFTSAVALAIVQLSAPYLVCLVALSVVLGGGLLANTAVLLDAESSKYRGLVGGLVGGCYWLGSSATAELVTAPNIGAATTLAVVAVIDVTLLVSFYWLCTRREIIVHKVRI